MSSVKKGPASSDTRQHYLYAKFLYSLLVAIRLVCIALPGYIHPDEHFQNPQITGQLVLGLKPGFTPWEWDPSSPSRSIVGPLMTTGWSFWILNKLSDAGLVALTSANILVASRLPFFFGSFAIDMALWRSNFKRSSKWVGLCLWASSWLAMVMFIRPFGNALISFIYALLLSQLTQIYQDGTATMISAFTFGVLSALGIFCHFTFLLYLAPLCWLTLIGLWKTGRKCKSIVAYWMAWIFGGILSSSVCIIADNIYYGNMSHLAISNILSEPSILLNLHLTPLNLIKYNMKTENIALHGLHPWYLHYTVNMLILLGPIYLYWVVSNLFFAGLLKMERFFFGSLVLFPLSMLSLNSHQEPRFLLPLVIPIILQVSRHVRSKAIFALWIVFNIALTILFGLLHQGGVIPTISMLSSPSQSAFTSLYFYKTYMPPRYLLANTNDTLRVPDLVGMDVEAVKKLLAKDDSSRKVLITPQSFASEFDHTKLISTHLPHLDLDNFRMLNSWTDTLSLSVYEIQTDPTKSK